MFLNWILIVLSLNDILAISLHRQNRIINGSPASEGQFPFIVSILRTVNEIEFKLCGGTIIEERWILTAAHCIVKAKVSKLKVYAGSLTFGRGIQYDVEAGYFHHNYKDGVDDIALLKLTEPIKYTSKIKKIELNKKRNVPLNKEATLIGWGLTTKPRTSTKLHYTNVKTTQCLSSNLIEHFLNIKDDTKEIICTSTDEGRGACSGDSGGPLVMDGRQIGIVSRGEPCATGYPDIYTNVAYYLDWIKNATDFK